MMKNIILILTLSSTIVFAEQMQLKLEYQKVNDTLDILNIKEKEFSGNKNLSSLGDMNGYTIDFKYPIQDNLRFNIMYNKMNLDYLGETLVNNKIDLNIRYKLKQINDYTFYIFAGYTQNKAEKIYITNISAINENIKRVLPNKDISISADGKSISYINSQGVSSSTDLAIDPYVLIDDTYDKSYYIQSSVNYKNFNIYAGYKQIKISNYLDSSIAHEDNDDIQNELNSGNSKASYDNTRDDAMLYIKFAYNFDYNKFHSNISYEYTKMLRINCLEETNTNNIIDLDLLYDINNDISFYVGGKLMSNQFNGEIPYFYTSYTKTTFDHKYGYAKTGLIFKF